MDNKWVDEIKGIIKNDPDRYSVHRRCKPVLEKMAASKEFLFDIIRYNLSDPYFLLRKRTYPTLSMIIEENSEFTFVVNIFPPLPDRSTNISFQSIHHHGGLLLSTVGVVGPGYQSILFNKGFNINAVTGETEMSVAKKYQNEFGVVEFVDSYQPHIVFYPQAISATYAFWCDEKKRAKEAIKKLGFLKNMRKPAARLINKLGLSKIFGLNKVEYFDFYTRDGKIIALKERLAYTNVGDNDNFLKNIFYFIQQTGFNDIDYLTKLVLSNQVPDGAKNYINKLINNEVIEDEFFVGHLNVPKVNLAEIDVLKAANNA